MSLSKAEEGWTSPRKIPLSTGIHRTGMLITELSDGSLKHSWNKVFKKKVSAIKNLQCKEDLQLSKQFTNKIKEKYRTAKGPFYTMYNSNHDTIEYHCHSNTENCREKTMNLSRNRWDICRQR